MFNEYFWRLCAAYGFATEFAKKRASNRSAKFAFHNSKESKIFARLFNTPARFGVKLRVGLKTYEIAFFFNTCNGGSGVPHTRIGVRALVKNSVLFPAGTCAILRIMQASIYEITV